MTKIQADRKAERREWKQAVWQGDNDSRRQDWREIGIEKKTGRQ